VPNLRRAIVIGLAVVLTPIVAAASGTADVSLARLTDTAQVTQSVTTDTLDPPTSLSATGGSSVSLSWTATVDTYAAGYDVLRGSVTGGPYSVVSSVTPRTTTSTTDSPTASGTWYYVLRSTFQSWTSVNSNQASAVVTLAPTNTGFHGCTGASNGADTGGDNDGYELNPTSACAADAAVATDASSGTNTTNSCADAGKDRHHWSDFGLGVPSSVLVVSGIQVRADVGLNNNAGNSQVCIQLSWDGGTTWTATKSAVVSSTAVTTYSYGAINDTWGRTWAGGDFANASFRVRVVDASDRATKDFKLDYLAVQVTYTP
jgi:hypothetical protein